MIKTKTMKVYQGRPGGRWRHTLASAYRDEAWATFWAKYDCGEHGLGGFDDEPIHRCDPECWEVPMHRARDVVDRLARLRMRRDGFG